MEELDQIQRAFKRFDEENVKDPNHELLEGHLHPKELLYAQRMTDRLSKYAPEASQALQLAARAHHLRRWEIPREDYPMDRAGYLKWRNDLKIFHAAAATEILTELGYDVGSIERVNHLIKKKDLKSDEETQTLEDVICLVFLEYYVDEFSATKRDQKMQSILKKTWRKMSDRAREEALQLPLSQRIRGLVINATTEEAE